MTAALDLGHIGPWTEDEFLALGETPDRVELFDGSLHVSPAPTPHHQDLSFLLAAAFRPAAKAAGLKVFETVNVRVKRARIPIPDLVIVGPIDAHKLVIDASAVRLVAEITSPSNAATDRVLKMHYYAEAGIGWYLLVEPSPTLTLRLFRLAGDHYVLDGVAQAGEPLRLVEPIKLDLDPATLDDN